MGELIITKNITDNFRDYMRLEEKSDNTIQKYMRDIKAFYKCVGNQAVTKELAIKYKEKLLSDGYAIRSINSIIASLNSFFTFAGCDYLKIKTIKEQRPIFCPESKELTRKEYDRLLKTAENKGNKRLNLILQTICGTGIRVSELKFITIEAVKKGEALVLCKGKRRSVIIVKALQKKLFRYASERNIHSGCIFITRTGKPVSRTNIWRDMKKLCRDAHVNPDKVFPHNLRHLFARVFYSIEKDIAKLADILGHSSINTTRIYIISTCTEHRQRMENMKLVI